MVNREGRKQLASALKKLVEGEISNDFFFGLQPSKGHDRALYEIWLFGQSLCHNFFPYRLKGANTLNEDARQTLRRCMLFLSSDLEYEWPSHPNRITCVLSMMLGAIVAMFSAVASQFNLSWLALGLLSVAVMLIIVPLTYGERIAKRKRATFWAYGNKDVWPFVRKGDLESTSTV